ncbi:MAG: signal peptidase I [Desulfotomaculaceae bacterium]|nr:signal peptidase I [Desulfotomaculaceae bacterium]
MDQNEAPAQKKPSFFKEILQSLLVAAVLAFLIHTFIMQNFRIPSGSMEPTLQIQDYIFASKLSYRLDEPKRGDIVVFKYPKDTSRYFVKRLIAVGGETVALKGGELYVDGQSVPEDYLPQGLSFPDYGPVTVPEGNYFMLGDNRNNSRDSRDWGFVPRNLIVGKEIFIYWPPDRIGAAG